MIKFKFLTGYYVQGPINLGIISANPERALEKYKTYLIKKYLQNI